MAAATLLLGTLATLPAGCDQRVASTTATTEDLAIVVSGDTGGWITPCGCTANQSGGLPRRATYLAQLASTSSAVLYLDAGGAPAGDSPYQQTRFASILAGEQAMGVAAHNLGTPELALGARSLRQLAEQTKAPFISANARDLDGRLIAEPFRMVQAGSRQIAVIGVVSRRLPRPDSIQVDEPVQAIRSAMASFPRRPDLLIVLAYLPQEELERLAAALPEADAILGGPTGQSIAPHAVGATAVASATRKGKFVVELHAKPNNLLDLERSRIVELNPAFADDPRQMQNLDDYLHTLAERDFTAADSGLVAPLPANVPAGFRVAGDAACASCHQAEHANWSGSKHAHAWQSLVDRHGFEFDSSCQQCHTVGYGLPGGFESVRRSPDRVNVSCENCHGPAAAHVEAPHANRTPWNAFDQCVRCHDAENSPTFDRTTYWARIAHGPSSTTREAMR